jgi:hypothetical protein
MKLWYRIKKYLLKKTAQKEVSAAGGVDRVLINLRQAKTVGILYEITGIEDMNSINQMIENIQNMDIEVVELGYENRMPEKEEKPVISILTRRDLNWFEKPKGFQVEEFKKYNFDILICAFVGECLPLSYLSAVSSAKFRVGKYNPESTDQFELMINMQTNQTLPYLLSQIDHYLNVLNKNG